MIQEINRLLDIPNNNLNKDNKMKLCNEFGKSE